MRMKAVMRLVGCIAAAAMLAASYAAEFTFAAIGDAPYTTDEEAQFIAMIGELNREDLAFVVHVGDFKSGYSECSDAAYEQRREWFALSRHPLIFAPGDNDWTDCWRTFAGAYRPAERLARLRELFFAEPQSLGQRTIALERQTQSSTPRPHPEHSRWIHGRVLFSTLNVPGGDNNLSRDRAEFEARDAAARAWIEESFALAHAKRLAGVVIMMQANPWSAAGARREGYAPLLATLRTQAVQFAGEVVLIHGDTHRFRVDHPLAASATRQRIANFTRIEVFGSPSVNWVRVKVTEEGGRVLFSAAPGS